jgi:iron complex transport system substrate-binding protein
MEELRSAAPHFMATSVVEHGDVYNNNRRRTAAGGSDFWESAIVRPDVVLAELAAIMSGEAVEPCYYQQLQ